MKKRIYGIVGSALVHSASPEYFTDKFRARGLAGYEYLKFEIGDIGELDALIRQTPDLMGVNVTIPHKQSVIPMLDSLDPVARKVGAVNCIAIDRSREGGCGAPYYLTGYNTDVVGFGLSLEEFLGGAHPRALILGTGGAARAVEYVLSEMRIEYMSVSRTPAEGRLTYAELTADTLASHPLIVNATPLGTFPATETLPPIPYDAIGSGHYLYDLVYNPPITRFLSEGARRGARIVNGRRMFTLQAEEAWRIWCEQ